MADNGGKKPALVSNPAIFTSVAMNPRMAGSASPSLDGSGSSSEAAPQNALLRPVRPARPTGYVSPQLPRKGPPKPVAPRLRANSNNAAATTKPIHHPPPSRPPPPSASAATSRGRANTSPSLDHPTSPTLSHHFDGEDARPTGARPRSETTSIPSKKGVLHSPSDIFTLSLFRISCSPSAARTFKRLFSPCCAFLSFPDESLTALFILRLIIIFSHPNPEITIRTTHTL